MAKQNESSKPVASGEVAPIVTEGRIVLKAIPNVGYEATKDDITVSAQSVSEVQGLMLAQLGMPADAVGRFEWFWE